MTSRQTIEGSSYRVTQSRTTSWCRATNPEIQAEIKRLSRDYSFVTLGGLVDQAAVSLATGIEIGKMAYGTGIIPFIRTSDVSNWEVKADFKHGVSQDIYDDLKHKVGVRAGDVLMVKDGTYSLAHPQSLPSTTFRCFFRAISTDCASSRSH